MPLKAAMPIPALVRGLIAFLLGFTLVLGVMGTRGHSATTLLPNGTQCFQQASGPLAGGSLNMYVPSTTTFKNTWKDSGQVTLNTNPINLDANGCAVIFGTGQYRQQIYTGANATGTLLYDVLTTDTSAFNSTFWAGTAGGTANAITVVDAGFNSTDGSVINFLALNSNTGATTLNVSGGGAIAIKSISASGPIALTSGCIVANNPVSVVYSSTAAAFLMLTPCPAGASSVTAVGTPQGYLTLASATDSPILTADAIAVTSVFYTPYVGNQIPIWNGTAYTIFTFSQLTLSLTASHLGNTLYDVFVFSNSGTPVLVTGPAWTNSAAGAGARGSGAGTTQLQRLNGLWVNAVQITAINGASSFTVPANQATYVGTIFIDQTAGQISAQLSYGQNRKWGVSNAYNRQPIILLVGDPTAFWTYNSVTRASNGTPGNAGTALTGLPEESVWANFNQLVGSATTALTIGIGLNSTTTFIGRRSNNGVTTGSLTSTMSADYFATPTIGINTFNELEAAASGSSSFVGTINNMLMTLRWRG